MVELETLNKTELLDLIRRQTGRRVSSLLTLEELRGIVNGNPITEFSKTEVTRKKLEIFIEQNWEFYQIYLPCRGQVNEGKCTIFNCSEGLHTECWLNIKDQIK